MTTARPPLTLPTTPLRRDRPPIEPRPGAGVEREPVAGAERRPVAQIEGEPLAWIEGGPSAGIERRPVAGIERRAVAGTAGRGAGAEQHRVGRIELRPWQRSTADARALAAAWADPAVARWNAVPVDVDVEAAARWIAGDGARRQAGRALDLVVVDPSAPATVLGEVGLVVVDADRRWAEVGYWIVADRRGEGLAAAALDLFSAWVLEHQPVHRLFARTAAANPAAGAVARRAGYRHAGDAAGAIQVWIRDPERRPPP